MLMIDGKGGGGGTKLNTVSTGNFGSWGSYDFAQNVEKISSLPFLLSCWCTVRFCTGEDAEGENNDLCQVERHWVTLRYDI